MQARTVHHIATLDLPALQAYRTLRRPMDHVEQGIFVAEGEKVVRRLIASNLQVVSFLLTPEWDKTLCRTEVRYDATSAEIYQGPKEILSEIVGYRMHQGIMAIGRVPPEPALATISDAALLVALDGLMNAENVGVVVRNCAGFGADAVLVGETSSSPYLRRAVRNSMGTIFRLPVIHSANLASLLRGFSERGIRIIGTDPHAAQSALDTDLTGGCCLVFGSEESGISPAVRKVCDQLVTIPMANETDSLNVSSASAVLLYEAARQRVSKY